MNRAMQALGSGTTTIVKELALECVQVFELGAAERLNTEAQYSSRQGIAQRLSLDPRLRPS